MNTKYENQEIKQKLFEAPGPARGVRAGINALQLSGGWGSDSAGRSEAQAYGEVTQAILDIASAHRLRAAFGGSRGANQVCAKAFTPIAGAGFAGDKEECSLCSYGKIFTLGDLYRYYVWKESARRTE